MINIGSGIALPLAKINAHLMILHAAIVREWPLTMQSAAQDARDIINHLDTMPRPDGLLTEDTLTAIDLYKEQIRDFITQLTDATPDTGAEEHISSFTNAERLQELITTSWNALVQVDREALGLSLEVSDAGQLP